MVEISTKQAIVSQKSVARKMTTKYNEYTAVSRDNDKFIECFELECR